MKESRKAVLKRFFKTPLGGARLEGYSDIWISKSLKEPVDGDYKNDRISLEEFHKDHDSDYHYNLWMNLSEEGENNAVKFAEKELIPFGRSLLRFKEGADASGDLTSEDFHRSVVFNKDLTAVRMLILEPMEAEPEAQTEVPF